MMARLLTMGLALLLVIGVPILSYLTARRADLRLIPRIDLYASAVISQWLLTALAIPVIWLAGPGFKSLGLVATPQGNMLTWAGSVAVIALGATGLEVTLERLGLWPEESDLVLLLIPATRLEKLMAVLIVAPTAAFCEELLYRGFLFGRLSAWLDSAPRALLVSALVFGLAHAYQGIHGMVRAALLGALLTIPVIRTGSLHPSMAAHFVIDAVALGWLGPRFLKAPPQQFKD